MKNFCLFIFSIIAINLFSQQTENVFIITTDGLRWQEVFGGVDSVILNDDKYTESSKQVREKLWDNTSEGRRAKLMPFMWTTIVKEGQIYGNRNKNNFANIKNTFGFSYPGYNEILTGYPDPDVNSNDKKENKNITVLEFLNNMKQYKGKVAAFTTWDVFPYIINEKRSGIPVNSGVELTDKESGEAADVLNEIQAMYPSLASDRHDFVTYFLAKDYIKKKKPRVMYISFDETDEFAHEGKYREYLTAAHTYDAFVKDLWEYCQKTPQYAGKTTFILTTDHGRGDKVKSEWTSHGQKVSDCGEIWIAALGPDTKPLGELKNSGQVYQNQIARTIASLLKTNFENGHPVGQAINSIYQK